MLICLLTNCTNVSNEEIKQIRSYADPISENLFKGIKGSDYKKFSADLSYKMDRSFAGKGFSDLLALLKSKVGDYESRSFMKVIKSKGFTTVVYKAEFSKEPSGVIVRVVFSCVDNKNLVDGLWFDSPNLRKK